MAPITMQQLIDKTIGYLNGPTTNRPKFGTRTAISLTGSTINTLTVEAIDGVNTHRGPAVMEMESGCLVFVSNWDASTGVCTVPAWGNGFEGTPAVTGSGSFGTQVSIDPIWPRWFVGQHIIDAINSMYPKLYGVRPQTLTSTTLDERYEVNTDVEEILSLKVEWYGSTAARREILRRSLQTVNVDGKRYISIAPIGVSGRPIHLVYKTKPVLPTDPRDASWTWTTSRLPDTASDLPSIKAAMTLIQSPEMAKMQVYSVETSERSKYVQAGSANAASRRLEELFERRMNEEQQALSFLNPMRMSQRYN